MERKKLVQFIFAFFIAIIFITSYAAFNSFGGAPVLTSKNSTVAPATVYAAGVTNATITNYTSTLNITILCKNGSSNITNRVNTLLGDLQTNGSVASSVSFGSNTTVLAGNSNTIFIYNYMVANTNSTAQACTNYYGGGVAELPASVKLSVEGQSATLQLGNRRIYVIPVQLSSNLSTMVPVRVSALLTQNGSIYGNLSVTRV